MPLAVGTLILPLYGCPKKNCIDPGWVEKQTILQQPASDVFDAHRQWLEHCVGTGSHGHVQLRVVSILVSMCQCEWQWVSANAMNITCWEEPCLASVLRPCTLKLKCLTPAAAARVHDADYTSQQPQLPIPITTTTYVKCYTGNQRTTYSKFSTDIRYCHGNIGRCRYRSGICGMSKSGLHQLTGELSCILQVDHITT